VDGGIALVMSSMGQFPMYLNIQRAGMTTIGNLVSTNDKNRTMVGNLGGVDLVLEAMARFPNDVTIQEAGCSTMTFLAKSPMLSKELRAKGAEKHVKIAKSVIADKTCAVNALHELQRVACFWNSKIFHKVHYFMLTLPKQHVLG